MATLTNVREDLGNLTTSLEKFYPHESKLADKVFLHQPIEGQWYTWTYGQAGQEIRKMAAYIKENFSEGAKIALLSRNCAHWIMAELAINMAGCTSVPLYPNIKRETVSYVLEHSDSEALLVGKLIDADWQEMRQGIPDGFTCIKMGNYSLDCDYKSWEEICDSQAPMSESPTRDINDIQTIIYTSGTTGRPKGVVLGADSLAFGIAQFDKVFNLTDKDRFFSYLPLSHIAERMLISQGALVGGSSIHFAESLDTFADNLKYAQPTIFLAVPRIWTKFQMGVLAKFPPQRLKLLTSLPILGGVIKKKIKEALGLVDARVLLTGAAPMSVSMLEWYEKLGMNIYDVYGMTENSALSHANMPNQYKFGTVGKVMTGVEMKLTEQSEICVKSRANMREYYKMPEKTAETLKDGWLHTGDKGRVDADGYLKITGRVKDLFKTSKAKYVAPNPIEQKIIGNPNIEQVCVVGSGIPQPLALVVLSETARAADQAEIKSSLEETLKEVNATLEHHEILQKMVVVKEEWTVENGILTPTLKIKRGEIDRVFEANYENWYEGGKGVIYQG
ncbi:MAG: AMP-binding protein [Bacteroidota bacterium]